MDPTSICKLVKMTKIFAVLPTPHKDLIVYFVFDWLHLKNYFEYKKAFKSNLCRE